MNTLDYNTRMRALRRGISEDIVNRSNASRLEELMDSRMVQEDERAIANASPRFIHKEFYHCYDQPDFTAVKPVPPRNRGYSNAEDLKQKHAMLDREDY